MIVENEEVNEVDEGIKKISIDKNDHEEDKCHS